MHSEEHENSQHAWHIVRLGGVLDWQAAETLLAEIQIEQQRAEEMKASISADAKEVRAKAAETRSLAEDAKRELDEALPALQAAVESLNGLNKTDITEIKSFAKPPPLVQMTLEVSCGSGNHALLFSHGPC